MSHLNSDKQQSIPHFSLFAQLYQNSSTTFHPFRIFFHSKFPHPALHFGIGAQQASNSFSVTVSHPFKHPCWVFRPATRSNDAPRGRGQVSGRLGQTIY